MMLEVVGRETTLSLPVLIQLLGAIPPYLILGMLWFTDQRFRKLPNRLVGAVAFIGLAYICTSAIGATVLFPTLFVGERVFLHAFMGALLGMAVPFCIDMIYRAFKGRSGFGFGDVKLLGALGLMIGPPIVLVFLVACIIGTIAQLMSLVIKQLHAVYRDSLYKMTEGEEHQVRTLAKPMQSTFAFGPYIIASVVMLVPFLVRA